jgi:hypothetical protein
MFDIKETLKKIVIRLNWNEKESCKNRIKQRIKNKTVRSVYMIVQATIVLNSKEILTIPS